MNQPVLPLFWSQILKLARVRTLVLFLFIFFFSSSDTGAANSVGRRYFLHNHDPFMTRVYVCMYVCTYVCTYVCKYVCMHLCIHVCMYVRMYVCIYVCTYVCMHICMYACMYVCVCVCLFRFEVRYLTQVLRAHNIKLVVWTFLCCCLLWQQPVYWFASSPH